MSGTAQALACDQTRLLVLSKLVFSLNLDLMEFTVRFSAFFLLVSLIDSFES